MLQTKGHMQAQDLELKQNQVSSLTKSNLDPAAKEKKLREACEGFESIFIQKMWQQMRATLPQENPLVGREEKFWQGMYDQELAKKMASSGGIGLADMMYSQLSRNLVSASRTTADAMGQNKGFEISSTPLLPVQDSAPMQAQSSPNALDQGTKVQTNDNKLSANNNVTQPSNVSQNITNSTASTIPNSIYSGAAPHMGESASHDANTNTNHNSNFVANASNNMQASAMTSSPNSTPIVEQYLTNIQNKQTATATTQEIPTGLELARQAQLQATNQPPLNGVLPRQNTPLNANDLQIQNAFIQPNANTSVVAGITQAMGNAAMTNTSLGNSSGQIAPGAALMQAQIGNQTLENTQQHIIRTTYTTNIPANERSKRKSSQHLTSGQPTVQNLTTAYPYGSSKVNNAQGNAAVQSTNARQLAQSPLVQELESSPITPVAAPNEQDKS